MGSECEHQAVSPPQKKGNPKPSNDKKKHDSGLDLNSKWF